MDKQEFIEQENLKFKKQMDPEVEYEKIVKGTDEIPTKFEEFSIVGVKYKDRFEKKTFSGREYSYYSAIDNLKVGDIVEVPTRYGKSIAMVSRINIDKKEIEKIKDFMKVIETKIDKEEFFSEGEKK